MNTAGRESFDISIHSAYQQITSQTDQPPSVPETACGDNGRVCVRMDSKLSALCDDHRSPPPVGGTILPHPFLDPRDEQ